MAKTPNLDACLSVIAQAFMDSFSLSETQLGKVTTDLKSTRALVDVPQAVKNATVSPARADQQASLRQRHPHVQTGGEGFLQAGQGAAASHRLRVQGLPAAGVQGQVKVRGEAGTRRSAADERCLSFQKHENEFNEAVALRELYRFIHRYFAEVSQGL